MAAKGVGGWTVRVEGLRETQRAFRRIDRRLPKRLRVASNNALRLVVTEAQRRANDRFTSHSGRTRGSIRAQSSQTSARVVFGGKRFPHAGGLEFGSNRFAQFSPWSGPGPGGAGSAGWFLFPAARAEKARFRDALARELRVVANEAGLRVRGL